MAQIRLVAHLAWSDPLHTASHTRMESGTRSHGNRDGGRNLMVGDRCRRNALDALVPLVPLALGPVLYVRSWRVWDLLVWDSEQPWHTRQPSRMPATRRWSRPSSRWHGASRRPLVPPSQVLPTHALAEDNGPLLQRIGDLMEGHAPDLARLAAQAERLDPGPRSNSAKVMMALLSAGSASLEGGDWRSPLLACRNQLGVRFSVRRALWPMRIAHVVMLEAYAIVVALHIVAGGFACSSLARGRPRCVGRRVRPDAHGSSQRPCYKPKPKPTPAPSLLRLAPDG